MSNSFPVLDDKTLFSSLSTLGVQSPHELKSPTEQIVKRVFLELLTEFTENSQEELQTLDPQCMSQADIHPDCYAKASSDMTLYLLMYVFAYPHGHSIVVCTHLYNIHFLNCVFLTLPLLLFPLLLPLVLFPLLLPSLDSNYYIRLGFQTFHYMIFHSPGMTACELYLARL